MTTLSRRDAIRRGLAAGAALVLPLEWHEPAQAARRDKLREPPFAPNAFVRIEPSGLVTIIVGSVEMGQGAHTSLAMILADELDADWARIRVQDAPVDPAYTNPNPRMQMTGGSNSVAGFWEPMRRAGAVARTLLVQAAAAKWGVPSASCRTSRGEVIHDESQRRLPYGTLVEAASRLQPPARVTLKDPKDFRLIGQAMRRVEAPSLVNGTARFGIDVHLPGMLTAVIARPPVLGGKLKRFDASATKQVRGVHAVVAVDAGVAVVADGFWQARKGRDALQVEWDDGALAHFDSTSQRHEYLQLLKQPGFVVHSVGDVDAALAKPARRIEAAYELPYLAPAPMEPLNCVADVSANHCRVWVGTQFPQLDRDAAADAAGLRPHQVELHTMLLGGGFGRRGVPDGHFVREAVQVSKAIGKPVKVIWTREDDIRGGYYRPASSHALTGVLDSSGKPVAWRHRMACQPILIGTAFAGELEAQGVDSAAYSGSGVGLYGIANVRTEVHTVKHGPTCWAFRSVGSLHNAFAREAFIDELAAAAGRDPFEYRRSLLGAEPRYQRVLELAASKADWGRKRGARRALGIAVHSHDSYVAQVADVSVSANGDIKVHRVVCAVDCGIAVDPHNVRAQMEGGTLMGLASTLYGRISFAGGRVEQGNFDDYRMLRIHDAPAIDVHIVNGGPSPLGVGEAGPPPIAPAVANAVAAATGERIRALPLLQGR
jgi:isoquinoline 1-oxidoreductase beta subunit